LNINISGKEGMTSVKSMRGLTSLLLCSCMFWRNDSDVLVPVTDKELMLFPSRVLSELSSLANELNGFTVGSMESAVKN
jgi:hypothetical protein